MNANKLADKIEDARNETDFQKWAGQAPDMLRQQQAEIEALKASFNKENPVKEVFNTEPVAELVLEQMAVGDASSLRVKWLMDGYPTVGTKLYTHPAKTLTDKEIEDLADKYLSVNYKYGEDIYVLGEVEFARAILRKAQEK